MERAWVYSQRSQVERYEVSLWWLQLGELGFGGTAWKPLQAELALNTELASNTERRQWLQGNTNDLSLFFLICATSPTLANHLAENDDMEGKGKTGLLTDTFLLVFPRSLERWKCWQNVSVSRSEIKTVDLDLCSISSTQVRMESVCTYEQWIV